MVEKEILIWLKSQVEDAHERLMEDMSNFASQDWEIVNDRTSQRRLPILIHHNSSIVRLLARQRLKGGSIYDTNLQEEMEKILAKTYEETGEKLEMGFAQGRLYQCAQLYEELGERGPAHQWKSWAWFNPAY